MKTKPFLFVNFDVLLSLWEILMANGKAKAGG